MNTNESLQDMFNEEFALKVGGKFSITGTAGGTVRFTKLQNGSETFFEVDPAVATQIALAINSVAACVKNGGVNNYLKK